MILIFRNLNDSTVVVIIANKNIIKIILESSSNVHVSHFIIIPLDGPLPPKPGICLKELLFLMFSVINVN